MDIRISIAERGAPTPAPGFAGALGATNSASEKTWEVEAADVVGGIDDALFSMAEAAHYIHTGERMLIPANIVAEDHVQPGEGPEEDVL